MNLIGRHGLVLVVTLLLSCLAWVPDAAAMPFLVVDQRNDGDDLGGGPFLILAPFGQEFTPTLDALDWVHILIGPRTEPVAVVNIRENTITGPILGTSLPGTIGPLVPGQFSFMQFDFSDRVPLVPGNLYVIEIEMLSGGLAFVRDTENHYAGGRAISLGNPVPGTDFGFREGLVVPVPEPGTVSLLSIGLLGLVGGVVRRRRSSQRENRASTSSPSLCHRDAL